MKIILVLVLALAAFAQTFSKKIVGGTKAPRGRYPYIAGLLSREFSTPYCGGSLVTPRIVYTAAHCPTPAYVFIGCLNWNEDCERIPVVGSVQHPNYSSRPVTNHDFRLLVLAHDAESEPMPYIADASWANFGEQGRDEPVTVIGFGTIRSGGPQSPDLLEVEVDTTTNDFCDSAYRSAGYSVDDTMLCAARSGKDACQGDSGGPIFVKCSNGADVQVGVVSWGIGCAHPSYPGVYGRLSYADSFFKRVLADNGQSVSATPSLSNKCGGTGFNIPDPAEVAVPADISKEHCLFGLLC